MRGREEEKDRKIELGVSGCGRDTGKHKNTENFHRRKEFDSKKQYFLFFLHPSLL